MTRPLSRRAILSALPASGITLAGSQLAHASQDQTPWWWNKLTGPGAESDPEVFHPWRDSTLSRELAVKLEELHELVLRMGAPVGVDTVSDFRLHWCNGVPQNVTIMGRSGLYGECLHCFRPEFGWRVRSTIVRTGSRRAS